ncbi:MAG: phage tail protein [Thiomicrospira sp.]
MADPFLGQITLFAGNYVPQGYADCNGQVIPIAQNEALFSLIGKTFGGDGINNFALPDFQGRLPVGVGYSPVHDPIVMGQKVGTETVTLTVDQIPGHSHALAGSHQPADTQSPNGATFAQTQSPEMAYTQAPPDIAIVDTTVSETGDGQPHSNLMPFTVTRFIIALTGTYPPRS